ncbi:DUF4032 domain-containing protein [Dermatophilus congolensis]|uniref:DUF4032 domain-containing protein n=1 Tax=Dermatophilus congolensis TaxID=1863 RepID=UPI001AAEC588|nr:DUF4032 domain-containing protein [Dermatophilus congolensis]MBO3132707.1 DUF4032 domain-containing protein [Dermatophilus congolensis]MBO3133130.1 DUF4032 domain-containing protein [Dermatophilus congolensis]MBO3135365.1 DUF4032 domain-containing protein [Dermatophilus congolensis]MBO3137606.1 DUF4032 domain-containing protein [Dermatophilus congolensis]
MALSITTTEPTPELLDLPWDTALEDWPISRFAALPRGISRHVVRFVNVGPRIIALKEIKGVLARGEYAMLRNLQRLDQPCVTPLGVVDGRTTATGQPLDAVLITEHLQFSLPYRALFSRKLQPDTAERLIGALTVLLVRLHLAGFWWGDVSLSNTLFRRDADDFSAYLVDAETGQLFPQLTEGQRRHDLDIAHVNIAGELMDLIAGGLLSPELDPIATSEQVVSRYHSLWNELTASEALTTGETWRMEERIRRLNLLGYNVDELSVTREGNGETIQITPKVVDAGYSHRRLMRLTGLDVQENQARRLLSDMDTYRASLSPNILESVAAHEWLVNVYEPVTANIPSNMAAKLEPAQVFHEVLEHRWYLSERAGYDVSVQWAFADYLSQVLPTKPDEKAIVGVNTTAIPIIVTNNAADGATGTHTE